MKNRVLIAFVVVLSTVMFSSCIELGKRNLDVFMLDKDTSLGYNIYKSQVLVA